MHFEKELAVQPAYSDQGQKDKCNEYYDSVDDLLLC